MESTTRLPHGAVLLRKLMWSSLFCYLHACHSQTSTASMKNKPV